VLLGFGALEIVSTSSARMSLGRGSKSSMASIRPFALNATTEVEAPSTFDCPPPHADSTARATRDMHPPAGGILAEMFDMVLRRSFGGWVHFGVNLTI
jgi:hypothetical protein